MGSQSVAITAEGQFFKAQNAFQNLIKDSEKVKFRHNWLPCIEMFDIAYKADPKGKYAAASLYYAGKSYLEMYGVSFRDSDRQEALDFFHRVVRHFPTSTYRPLAEQGIQSLTPGNVEYGNPEKLDIEQKTPPPKGVQSKASYISSLPEKENETLPKTGSHTTINGLRYWSNPNYTRIVIDAGSEASYSHNQLNEDPIHNKPLRLYVDFANCRLGDEFEKVIPINDELLSDVRASQYSENTVRVVADIKSFKTYKIFSLKNPFRIVLDVWGKDVDDQPILASGVSPAKTSPAPPSQPAPERNPVETQKPKIPEKANHLARQFALGVRRIVIDPGHGGKDSGAVGHGLLEKDIVLKLGKRVAAKIRESLGCQVIMTRDRDVFLTLEERTAIANTKNADLFVSIHTNASPDARAYGIETYFLNLATDEDAIRVAARENATSRKNISDLQAILMDLMHNAKINESSRLAAHVQKSMCNHMSKKYSQIKNKGVKQAPFYVLIGAQMPSILVETSFITHSREAKRLNESAYQELLCNAIVDGIRKYIQETNPTAVTRMKNKSNS